MKHGGRRVAVCDAVMCDVERGDQPRVDLCVISKEDCLNSVFTQKSVPPDWMRDSSLRFLSL